MAENKEIDFEQDSEPPTKQMREYNEFELATFKTDAFTESFLSNLQPTITASENVEESNHSSTATSTEYNNPTVVNQEVINASSTTAENVDPEHLSLEDKIVNISRAFQETSSDPEILSVRRRKLWQDTAQKLGRLYANCIIPFSVSFIREAGVDAGGPKREFFSLRIILINSPLPVLPVGNQY